jgi:hypothetical protein
MSVLEFFNTQHIFGIFLKLFGVIVGFLYGGGKVILTASKEL